MLVALIKVAIIVQSIKKIKNWKIKFFTGILILRLKSVRIKAKEKNKKQESLWYSPKKPIPDHELNGIKKIPSNSMGKNMFFIVIGLIVNSLYILEVSIFKVS